MSDNNNNDSGDKNPKDIEKFSEEERKEVIEKMRQYLAADDGDKVILYASLSKVLL